ncbi:MAG: sugar phosphate nucleotidyltransferase [archaeon]
MGKLTINQVVNVLLGGGRSTRLGVMTQYAKRTKGAVAVGGKFRLVDYPLTNISETNRAGEGQATDTYLMLQWNPRSLHRHVGTGEAWGFSDRDMRLHMEYPVQTNESDKIEAWSGTVRPLTQKWDYIFDRGHTAVLVATTDHVYRANYRQLIDGINRHSTSSRPAHGAIFVYPVGEEDAKRFGIMRVNKSGRIIKFVEKPQTEEELERLVLTDEMKDSMGIERDGRVFLGSMGVYLFMKEPLREYAFLDGYTDFGKHVIPKMIKTHRLYAVPFDGVWCDIGERHAYHGLHMRALEDRAFGEEVFHAGLITSRARQLSDMQVYGTLIRSMKSPGTMIGENVTVEFSVLGYQVFTEDTDADHPTVIKRSILNGADRNEVGPNGPIRPVQYIGRGVTLENVITDKNVRIGHGVSITPANGLRYERRIQAFEGIGYQDGVHVNVDPDGLVTIGKGLHIPDNFRA